HSPLPTFFQRRIPGTPAAAIFIAADGIASLLGLTRQLIGEAWLGAHGFQYAGSIGPLPISEPALAIVKVIGNTLADRFELVGLFGVDFILNGDEVWTLEVNPRYTASVEIIERITGIHSIAAHSAACTGSPPTASRIVLDPDRYHGKATLFARHEITITPAFAEWSLAEATCTPWPTLADVSLVGTHIEAGRPLLTLFAEAATPDKVEQQLRQRVAEIELKLYAAREP
ncbi:MAG: ATP-grasp domain-containing protein, partial [Pirellulales bacterium]